MPVFVKPEFQHAVQRFPQFSQQRSHRRQIPMLALTVLLASGLAVSACAAKPPEKTAMSDQEPQVISLTYRQPVTLKEGALKVEVTDLTDSRCPVNARCVWAGQATASLKVSMTGKAEEKLVIGTPAPPTMNLPGEAVYGAYRFSLVGVSPAKASPDAIAPEAYKFEVRIVKSGD